MKEVALPSDVIVVVQNFNIGIVDSMLEENHVCHVEGIENICVLILVYNAGTRSISPFPACRCWQFLSNDPDATFLPSASADLKGSTSALIILLLNVYFISDYKKKECNEDYFSQYY